jgi:diguanylate cyclase (GGDEF)-like protein
MTAPLFILSFRHRDELSRLAESDGWMAIAARRGERAEPRFLMSGARVALVDARGAAPDGLAAVRAIAEAVEANAGALLVLVSRVDEPLLPDLFEAGATHFLVSPFSEAQLLAALRFAARHAERVGGGHAVHAGPVRGGPTGSWRWRPGEATLWVEGPLAQQLGLAPGEVPLARAARRLGSEGVAAARAAVRRLIGTSEPTAFAHDPPGLDGRLAHHLRFEDGRLHGFVERIAAVAAGAEETKDLLTGVADARAARAWIEHRLAAGGGEGPRAVALLLSLTRFDAINSAFGRASGDAVLQAAARRIERHAQSEDGGRLVARLAGAEFALLLAAPASVADARHVAGRLVEALGRPFVSGDHAITIGCRIGIAMALPGDSAASLLRRASTALAEAKGQDGAPVSLIDAESERASVHGDRLEVDLRRALDAGQIQLLFQPQVAIATGEIVGVEALARWRHPAYGPLGAATLFGVAERSDYLVELSGHVQKKALAAAAAWPEPLRGLRLAVNVTAQDIQRPGFAAQFLADVAQSGLDPARVTVEVTESGLMADLPAAAALLAELRRGGLRIAIDDFGTGYSSLAYLKALPLDYLKLDKRLCEDIAGSPRDRVVVESVIGMATSLGLKVIAEGVETAEQLALLAAAGCAIYQGYLCAPPLTAERLAQRMAAAASAAGEAA